MPFSSTGTYTPPSGTTTTSPGTVIRSSAWNTAFGDASDALTQVGQSLWLPRTASAGSFTVNVLDRVVNVTASAPTISLPLASTKEGPVAIIGSAATVFGSSNSVLKPTSPDTINGAATFTLSSNYQGVVLYPYAGGYVKI